MPIINEQLEIERSRDFFTDPNSYAPFDLDEYQRKILGCIDPRDQESTRLATLVQTPGGAIGTGLDLAIAETAINGDVVSIETGMVIDRNVRSSIKLGAHHNCKFVAGIPVVLDKMIEPDEFSEQTTRRWINYYNFNDELSFTLLNRVQDAAKRLREGRFEEDELLSWVERLDKGDNVVTMSGENTAKIYMVNHHSKVGLNRHKKHRETGIKVQGYHDSLGATISNLKSSTLDPERRRYALGAHIIKAAAVQSVIGDAETLYFEGIPTDSGLQVAEVERAA